jgi:hypothetical protein
VDQRVSGKLNRSLIIGSCIHKYFLKKKPKKLRVCRDIEKVIEGVNSALDYLHTEKLMMHADIKSANVLIKNDFETGINRYFLM